MQLIKQTEEFVDKSKKNSIMIKRNEGKVISEQWAQEFAAS